MDEEQLVIYGSYEKAMEDTQQIKGHNNTMYTIGGNARFNARNCVIDWYLINDTQGKKIFEDEHDEQQIVQLIHSLLKINPPIKDQTELSNYLNSLINSDSKTFLNEFIKVLKINEPILICLRRLHYIILKMLNIDKNHSEFKSFCPYEPVDRLRKIMNNHSLPISKVKANNITMISLDTNRLIDEVKNIYFDNPSIKSKYITHSLTKKDQPQIEKIKEQFAELISLFTKAFPLLEQIEHLYIRIASKLESICDILESE